MSLSFANYTYSPIYNVAFEKAHLQQIVKSQVSTHINIHAERLHKVSEALRWPANIHTQLLGRIIQPLPGAYKDHVAWGVLVRITCIVLWILLIPISILSGIFAYPLRLIDHRFRPAISYIDASKESGAQKKSLDDLHMTSSSPLHIRTHNLGLVPASMSNSGDLRDPVERSHEIVKAVINDPKKPDIILFQEAFHENAVHVLCEGLKREYPYIIYNVAPHSSGFTSGAMMASKYPPTNLVFQCLDHNIFPETLSPKGVMKVRFDTNQGPLFLYNMHTQALIGEDRAKARYHQLGQIKRMMDADKKLYRNVLQVLCGDLNTSRINAWGGDNANPSNQAEAQVLARLSAYFTDPFLKDHEDELTGKRTKGISEYLSIDNQRVGVTLDEPRASWFDGPYYHPGLILSCKMKTDRSRYGRDEPKQGNPRNSNTPWGTKAWRNQQPAENARFDYILFPKTQRNLDATVEIRRLVVPEGTQSASSDHLPVDGKIWCTSTLPQ